MSEGRNIALSFDNILNGISLLSPILISFFLLMLSIINSDIKAYVYLGGVLIALFINYIIVFTIGGKKSENQNPMCNLIDFPFFSGYNKPAVTALFLAFTFAYTYMPMKYISSINYPFLITMLAFIVIDAITKLRNACTDAIGIVIGLLLGFFLGVLWFVLFYGTGHKDLLYFGVTPSNKDNTVCSRPSKQTFKCFVYKNGEIISKI